MNVVLIFDSIGAQARSPAAADRDAPRGASLRAERVRVAARKECARQLLECARETWARSVDGRVKKATEQPQENSGSRRKGRSAGRGDGGREAGGMGDVPKRIPPRQMHRFIAHLPVAWWLRPHRRWGEWAEQPLRPPPPAPALFASLPVRPCSPTPFPFSSFRSASTGALRPARWSCAWPGRC